MQQLDNELGNQLLSLVKQQVRTQAITDRSQQYWDQLVYDAHFRGKRSRIGNVNGRMGLYDLSLSTANMFEDEDQPPPPPYDFNLFRRSVRQFTALFGSREPSTRISPVNPRNPQHVARARLGNRINLAIDAVLKFRAIQSRLAFLLGKSGPVFAHTRWVSSGDQFGFSEIPILQNQPVQLAPPAVNCPSCGASGFLEDMPTGYCPHCGGELQVDQGLSIDVQMPTGEFKSISNGSLVCSLHTLTSVTIPGGFYKQSDLPWLAHVEEMDRSVLARAYDIPLETIRSFAGGMDIQDPTGPQARAQISSYDGRQYDLASTEKATRGRYWLEPTCFDYVQNEQIRTLLTQNMPRGACVHVVSGKVVKLDAESHKEVWTGCLPEESETLTPGPYLEDTIGIGEVYNDAWEIAIESAAHSIPLNIFDPDIISASDLQRHGRLHGSFVPSKQRGRDPSSGVARFYPSEYRHEMNTLSQELFAKNDEMQGLLPIIWGSVAGAETAFETDSARNQALAMLAIPWLQMRGMHEGIRRQAIVQLAKHSDGNLHLPIHEFPPPENKIQVATIEELDMMLEGGWKVESDEQMPMSAGQIKQGLLFLIHQAPEIAQQLELTHPANLPLIHQYLGIPGMRTPRLEMVEAIQDKMQDLLATQPISEQQSSEPLDTVLYDPEVVVQIFKPWLISREGRNEQQVNPGGWYNVRLFAQEAEMLLQQQMQQQMMQQQQTEQPGGPPPQPEQAAPPM